VDTRCSFQVARNVARVVLLRRRQEESEEEMKIKTPARMIPPATEIAESTQNLNAEEMNTRAARGVVGKSYAPAT